MWNEQNLSLFKTYVMLNKGWQPQKMASNKTLVKSMTKPPLGFLGLRYLLSAFLTTAMWANSWERWIWMVECKLKWMNE